MKTVIRLFACVASISLFPACDHEVSVDQFDAMAHVSCDGGTALPVADLSLPDLAITPDQSFSFCGLGAGGYLQGCCGSFEVAAKIVPGMVIKGEGTPYLYYIDAKGLRHTFPTINEFLSWYASDPDGRVTKYNASVCSIVMETDQATLSRISIGSNVTMRPGGSVIAQRYAMQDWVLSRGRILRFVRNRVLVEIYGNGQNYPVYVIPEAFFVNYRIGAEAVDAADYDRSSQLKTTIENEVSSP